MGWRCIRPLPDRLYISGRVVGGGATGCEGGGALVVRGGGTTLRILTAPPALRNYSPLIVDLMCFTMGGGPLS